ncbi:MAG: hypothetical protein P4L33_05875 [Capsulimonadaceae bacterium]|nr:hypothetical protein [Capsulimonadaceae bacterium]
MEKKSVYNTRDGRSYEMVVTWSTDIKLTETVFPIQFRFTDKATGQPVKLPREIATFAIGGPEETLDERIKMFYEGDKNAMFIDYVEMAMRRATDYVERGR